MLCGVQVLDVLGVTVVVTALPRMLADLDASPSSGAVLVTAYAILFGGTLMLAARVGERIGPRRILIAALVVYAAGSLLGALATSVWMLGAARGIQGLSAAASVPAALGLLTGAVPEGRRRQRAVAAWSAAGAAGGGIGFVVGGIATDVLTWRALFWMTIIVAASFAAAAARVVPPDSPTDRRGAVGWPSGVLLTVTTMGLIGATTAAGEGAQISVTVGLAGVWLITLVAFVRTERKGRAPLLTPEAWRSRTLRWGVVGSFANTATTSSSFTVATLVLQDNLGLSAIATGGLLVSISVLVVVGSAGAPRILRSLGWGPTLATGLLVIACADATMAVWPTITGIGIAAAVCGLGLGVASVAATDLGTTVPNDLKTTAAGVINTAAQLGAAVGTGALLVIATTGSARLAWTLAAVGAIAIAIAAIAWAPRRRPDNTR